MDLSIRMKAVADMVEPGSRVADIGCDHAFIPIYLVKNNIAQKVIASDARRGPADIAKKNVAEAGFENNIEVRMDDGLHGIKPGETDTIIMSGMGGMLIIKILSEGKAVLQQADSLILQPQSDIMPVRQYLNEIGFVIHKEKMVYDAGKYYVIMGCRNTAGRRSDMDLQSYRDNSICTGDTLKDEACMMYGRYMLENQDEVLYAYLKDEHKKTSAIIKSLSAVDTENAKWRQTELEYNLKLINRALEYFAD